MQQIALQEGMTSANHSFPSGSVVQPSVQHMTGPVPTTSQASTRSVFFAKVCQAWSDDWKHWVSGTSPSTKNQDDVLLLGFLETVHHKAQSANTSHENNLTRLHPLVHSPAADRR